MKILYSEPYFGEWGFLLSLWNPYLRNLSREFDCKIICGPRGSDYLHEFADIYIPLKTEGYSFEEGTLHSAPPIIQNKDKLTIAKVKNVFKYRQLSNDAWHKKFKLKHRKLGLEKTPEHKIDVVCAFRPPKFYRDGRLMIGKHYGKPEAAKVIKSLIDRGLKIACFGGKDNYYFGDTIDYREKPLVDMAALVRSAKVCVGPSSGTIHFASLCETPQVVWFGQPKRYLKNRYEVAWNPFKTSVKYITNINPSPEEIVEQTLRMIDKKHENFI